SVAWFGATWFVYAQTPAPAPRPAATATKAPATKAAAPAANAVITTAEGEKAAFNQYCVGCHGDAAKKRGEDQAIRLTIDSLDPAHVENEPEVWERVVRKMRAGMMPPAGMRRPDANVYESMITYLEKELDRTTIAKFTPPGLHRLNRAEYANAVRDLL